MVILAVLAGVLVFASLLLIARSDSGSPALSFNVGKTESSSMMSSASTSSSHDNSTFNCGRVLFIETDPGRFSQRIAQQVVRGLTNCPVIEHVEVARSFDKVTDGLEAPDLFVRIHVVDVSRSGLLSSTIKARVRCAFGSAPWSSSHYTQRRSSSPSVQFNWTGTVENESKFSGVRSDRYAETVQSIADQFVKGISNEVASLSAKYPAVPELPRSFYGPYQPVGDFDCLKELKAKRACSNHGLFSHNDTFWEFETASNPAPQLQHVIDQLSSNDWKVGYAALTNTMDQSVELHSGDTTLEIFREDRFMANPAVEPPVARFVAHYHKPFSDAEIDAALDTILTNQPAIEKLLPFQSAFSSRQRSAFNALLEKAPSRNPIVCLQLAETYWGRKQTNAAIDMLVRAKALRVALNDYSQIDSRIDDLAKKISPKKELKVEVTPEVCRELGFFEATKSTQHIETERKFDEPVIWFAEGERGVVTSGITIRSPRRGICDWKYMRLEDHGSSSQSSSFDSTKQKSWQQSFGYNNESARVIGRLLPDGQRVAFTVDLQQ